MKMPFGKYKGDDLDDILDDYLQWVLDNCDIESETLLRAIEIRMGLRARSGPTRSPPPPPPPPPSSGGSGVTIEKVIRAWHRQMALKYHPDRGGSHEVMLAINEGAELLKQLAGIK